jgi:GrpB-like predicted nucleotidyltransferase (UPF0157 family)
VQGTVALQNHLTLRKCLRQNSGAAEEYGRLKRRLAERFPTSIDRYIEGKTDFILGVLRAMGLTEQQLNALSAANRLRGPAEIR